MISRLVLSGGLVLCALAAAAPCAAQQTTAAPKSKSEAKHHKGQKRESQFRALALVLQTTPEALDTQYKTAKAANPYLKRKQFVTALVLAHDLTAKHPTITTDRLLAGLKQGKSIGTTLQDLGLSASDAAAAEKAAKQQAKASERR